jgi:HNH endonuclease
MAVSRRWYLNELVQRHGPNCHWCGKQTRIVDRDHTRRLASWVATVDHLLPRSRGGHTRTGGLDNIRVACLRCNIGRAAAGHCIAALRCAQAVLGNGASQGQIARWFRASQ